MQKMFIQSDLMPVLKKNAAGHAFKLYDIYMLLELFTSFYTLLCKAIALQIIIRCHRNIHYSMLQIKHFMIQ